MLPRSFPHGLNLFFGILDSLTAGAAGGTGEVLQLATVLVVASYHERPAAGVAGLTPHKSGTAAERTGRSEWYAATWADRVAALNFLETLRAVKTKGRTAATFWAETAVSLDEFPAMDAGFLVSSHVIPPLVRRSCRRSGFPVRAPRHRRCSVWVRPPRAMCRIPGRT